MDWIFAPWPWYVSGPLIALVMVALLLAGKSFGMSANLRTFCTVCGADRSISFFRFDWRTQRWNLLMVAGTIIGGFIGATFLSDSHTVAISAETVTELNELGITSAGSGYLPSEMFGSSVFSDPKGLSFLIIGGFLVGFGARWAGGCTSGHAISGLSNLQLPSLLAVIGFFLGGIVMVHLIFPVIL
jgi:uncharacterized membrane protein YedE/YeeE